MAYSYQIDVTGGTAPYTFQLIGGSLPVDFSLSGSGLVTGVSCQNANGNYKFDVRVTDSATPPVSTDFTGVSGLSINMTAGPNGTCSVTINLGGLPSTGTVGAAYSGSATSSGGAAPYTYSLASGSLPPGLSLSSGGSVSGTPTSAGSYSFQLRSQDSAGSAGVANYTITISTAAISVTPASLSGGTVGSAYSATFGATGGSGSYTGFAVTSGSLPAGLSLNGSTGALSGTPTASGTSNFTITVTDSASATGNRSYSITIANSVISVTPASLSGGTVGTAYSATFGATGGSGSYTGFAVTSGSLPAGLSLNGSTGALSGTPTASGTSNFTITVTDSASATGSRSYSITIANSGISVTPASLSGGTVGTAYSATFGATGGSGSYTGFAVTSGSLPAGLSLNGSTGALSGTPTASGTSNFTVTVTDSASATGSRSYSIDVANAGINVSPASLPGGWVGTGYSSAMSATGGTGSYTSFAVTSGSLPAGLSLNGSTGALSGTPTASGTSSFTVTVTDSASATGSRSYSIEIAAAPSIMISPDSVPGGTAGVAYSQTFTATGCGPVARAVGPRGGDIGASMSVQASCLFSISGGALPPGLTLSAAGLLSGTPVSAGRYVFTITAASGFASGSRTYTLVVGGPLSLGPPELASATHGAAYSQRLLASGGVTGGAGPYRYDLVSGALPPGLALDGSTGEISGIPAQVGRFTFTARATDPSGAQATASFTIVVAGGATLTIDPDALPNGLDSGRYEASVTAKGGTAPYSYAVVAGSLPPGITLDANTGAIKGMPAHAGEYRFTIQATDSVGDYGHRDYTIVIESRPDPSRDAEVVGIVDSQMQAGVRFAQGQIDNVMLHMQSVRAGFSCGLQQNVSVNVGPTQAPPIGDVSSRPGAETQGSAQPAPAAPHGDGGGCTSLPQVAFWTAGALDYGSTAPGSFNSTGLTLGVEAHVARQLLVGAALGTGFGNDKVGNHGTTTDSKSFDFMAYASYRLTEALALEAMGGYGTLHVDNRRFVTADGGLVDSSRPGRLLYGSLSLGGLIHAGGLQVSPYLRNDLVSVRLDGYSEGSSTPFALGFGAAGQTVDVLVAGTRLGYGAHVAFVRISPVVRIDYRHRFTSHFTQALFYVDRPEITYDLPRDGESRDFITAAAGLEAAIGRLTIGIEYGSSATSLRSFGDHSLLGTARVGF